VINIKNSFNQWNSTVIRLRLRREIAVEIEEGRLSKS
jgi:hypothetical protein